jgi:hypothetical protein
MHESAVIVAGALGIDLVEPAGWTCCGVQVIAERYSSKSVYAGPRYGFSRHSRRTRRLDGKMLRQIQAPKNRASSLDGELRVIIREDHRI